MSEWISVEDRLPPLGWVEVDGVERVLTYRAGGISIEWREDFYGAPCWSNDAEKNAEVTHWMPLPEPPK